MSDGNRFRDWRLLHLGKIQLLVICSLLVACAAQNQYFPQPRELSFRDDFTLTMPAGWVLIQNDNKRFIITRDGVEVQAAALSVRKLENAFRNQEKDASEDLPIEALSELYEAEIRQNAGSKSVEVLQSAPAEFAGSPAFLLDFIIYNERGLRWQNRVYGQVRPDGFYLLRYQAPKLHYFGRDLAVFEAFAQSARYQSGS